MFSAHGNDQDALARLGAARTPIVTDGERVRRLLASADAARFIVDD